MGGSGGEGKGQGGEERAPSSEPQGGRTRMRQAATSRNARGDHGGGWRGEIDRERDQWPRSAGVARVHGFVVPLLLGHRRRNSRTIGIDG